MAMADGLLKTGLFRRQQQSQQQQNGRQSPGRLAMGLSDGPGGRPQSAPAGWGLDRQAGHGRDGQDSGRHGKDAGGIGVRKDGGSHGPKANMMIQVYS